MQKKLLAVAIAGAFGAPALALAQSSTVQIYGTLYVEYSFVDQPRNAANTADLTKTDFLQTPGSSIGFKGEEKLGGGLSAWFQCESSADPRGQNGDGFCTRNSALGLKGGFGNVFIGNWDSPFKRTISPTNVGGNDTGIFARHSCLPASQPLLASEATPGSHSSVARTTASITTAPTSGASKSWAWSPQLSLRLPLWITRRTTKPVWRPSQLNTALAQSTSRRDMNGIGNSRVRARSRRMTPKMTAGT